MIFVKFSIRTLETTKYILVVVVNLAFLFRCSKVAKRLIQADRILRYYECTLYIIDERSFFLAQIRVSILVYLSLLCKEIIYITA